MARSNVQNLGDLLSVIEDTYDGKENISIEDVMDRIGRRSFGPLLLIVGVIYSTPVVGDIPGVPTVLGILLIVVAVQLLLGRKHIWLPKWILKRSVSSKTMDKTLSWIRKPATFIDNFIRPRLRSFTGRIATYTVALLTTAIALLTPTMEIVPLSANVAGLAILCFGLGLVARDGLLIIVGMTVVGGLGGLLFYVFI